MMKQSATAALVAQLISLAAAGTTVWDGGFSDVSVSSLDDWSWSNQIGDYQWYIHGDGLTSDYVAFDAAYANPADSTSSKGAKISLTDTSFWNGQTMRRTELIPQASDASALTTGVLYYHFSLKREDTNSPSVAREHQIAFFESHFTELKYGLASGASGSGDNTLRWMANSAEQWNVTMEAGVWHNCAYEIDFDANTVGFWHSTGGDELTQVVSPVSASVSSNGADWHVGVLELPVDGVADATEDLYFSGVYIESGDISTAFSGSSGSSSGSSAEASSAVASSVVSSSVVSSSSVVAAAATTSSVAASSTNVAVASSSSSAPAVESASSSAAPTSAAPATTLAPSSKSSCKTTKTVWVTAFA